jgi:hypothetical protein
VKNSVNKSGAIAGEPSLASSAEDTVNKRDWEKSRVGMKRGVGVDAVGDCDGSAAGLREGRGVPDGNRESDSVGYLK